MAKKKPKLSKQDVHMDRLRKRVKGETREKLGDKQWNRATGKRKK